MKVFTKTKFNIDPTRISLRSSCFCIYSNLQNYLHLTALSKPLIEQGYLIYFTVMFNSKYLHNLFKSVSALSTQVSKLIVVPRFYHQIVRRLSFSVQPIGYFQSTRLCIYKKLSLEIKSKIDSQNHKHSLRKTTAKIFHQTRAIKLQKL